MTDSERFLWGFLGSLAAEILIIHQAYLIDASKLPVRYRKIGFWVVRFILAVIGGGLVVAYGVDGKILAVNIGASAPVILQSLMQGVEKQK